jgi:hypothetical protein
MPGSPHSAGSGILVSIRRKAICRHYHRHYEFVYLGKETSKNQDLLMLSESYNDTPITRQTVIRFNERDANTARVGYDTRFLHRYRVHPSFINVEHMNDQFCRCFCKPVKRTKVESKFKCYRSSKLGHFSNSRKGLCSGLSEHD